ncbi:hypothetical protein QBC44DRAFT_302864 [Cladorrhinum sp. PSN332]|nr:hypothetical protein QBC44DRAFT_302864 [Cladorrhinum sp. PSN332]
MPRSLNVITPRDRDYNGVPFLCVTICTDAYHEAQRVGKRPELCASDSKFSGYYSSCRVCIETFATDPRQDSQDLNPAFGSYVDYCSTDPQAQLLFPEPSSEAPEASTTSQTLGSPPTQASPVLPTTSTSPVPASNLTKGPGAGNTPAPPPPIQPDAHVQPSPSTSSSMSGNTITVTPTNTPDGRFPVVSYSSLLLGGGTGVPSSSQAPTSNPGTTPTSSSFFTSTTTSTGATTTSQIGSREASTQPHFPTITIVTSANPPPSNSTIPNGSFTPLILGAVIGSIVVFVLGIFFSSICLWRRHTSRKQQALAASNSNSGLDPRAQLDGRSLYSLGVRSGVVLGPQEVEALPVYREMGHGIQGPRSGSSSVRYFVELNGVRSLRELGSNSSSVVVGGGVSSGGSREESCWGMSLGDEKREIFGEG